MLPQMHNDSIWHEEQIAPSLEQEPIYTPTSPWRGWSRWLRVLGVAVPLLTSFVCAFIDLSLLMMTIPFLLGLVCGGLLRSRWSIFIVPIAFSVGLSLSSIFLGDEIFLSSMANPVFAGPPAITFLGIFGIVPLVIGAAIGTPIGIMMERLLHH